MGKPIKKSGDSKLADAQVARRENRHEVKPNVEELPEMLQDAAERKAEAGADPEMVRQTQLALEKLTALVEGLNKRAESTEAQLAQLKGGSIVRGGRAKGPKCPTCRQVKKDLTGAGVCDGEHETAFVAPQDRSMWPSFPGVRWNGVYYAGYTQLPKVIVSDVISQVRRWETGEKKLFIKGGVVFGGNQFETANTAVAPIITAG